jgi:hypothetical protein
VLFVMAESQFPTVGEDDDEGGTGKKGKGKLKVRRRECSRLVGA